MEGNTKELFEMHADFCKFMGNAKRIEILFLLGEEELCVEDMANKMSLPIPNVSQHLAIMREKGIVASRRAGTKIYYHLANWKTMQACILMREAMIERMVSCAAKVARCGQGFRLTIGALHGQSNKPYKSGRKML